MSGTNQTDFEDEIKQSFYNHLGHNLQQLKKSTVVVTGELRVGELSDSATTAASMNDSSVENLGCQLVVSICSATGSDISKYKAQLVSYYFRAEL